MSMGRKPIEVTKEMLEKAEHHAATGLTYEQIAHCLGMGKTSLYKKMGEFPELLNSIKRGKSRGIGEITNALYENAKNGNVTAQIFFLKNRDPTEWRDKKDVHVTDSRETMDLLDLTEEQFAAEFITLRRLAHQRFGAQEENCPDGRSKGAEETKH